MRLRIFWIDVVKVIAIIMVALAHVLWLFEQGLGTVSAFSDAFLTVNRVVASLGVPLFMMVSGALLLGKKFEAPKDVLSFYKKGLFPLFVTAEIWIVIYCLLNLHPFSVKELLLCITFIHKPEVHLWYVRLIVIYYLMLPLIKLLLCKKNFFMALLLAIFAFTFLYNGWLIWKGNVCPTSTSRSYFCYLDYMAVGYVLAKSNVTKKCVCILAALGILGGYVLYHSLLNSSYFLWYDNPMLAVVAISLFCLLRYLFSSVSGRECLVEISKMSYGIYLSHFILIYFVQTKIQDCNFVAFYGVLFAILCVDIFLIFAVKKYLPIVSKILFRF